MSSLSEKSSSKNLVSEQLSEIENDKEFIDYKSFLTWYEDLADIEEEQEDGDSCEGELLSKSKLLRLVKELVWWNTIYNIGNFKT